MENSTEANPVFENLVDLHYRVVRFVATAVSHVVDMEGNLHYPQFSLLLLPPQFGLKAYRDFKIPLS